MTTRGERSRRRRRRIPPWWVWVPIGIVLGVIVWLRVGDPTGDQGMTNVFTGMLTILAALIALGWFVFARAYPLRARLAVLAAVILLYAGFRLLFRVEGVTGSMVPILTPRWAGEAAGDTPVAGPVERAAVPSLAIVGERDFPGFLGPGRDLTVSGVELAADWANRPPERLWRRPIGAGWSGFAVVAGIAVTQEEVDGEQAVSAFDAQSGGLLWRHTWEGRFEHPLGGSGPRATPTIDEGLVYALGPLGRLWCLDGTSGAVVWERNLLQDYGVTPEREAATVSYGRSNSPLVHGELLVVAAGGTAQGRLANLVALDKRTGETVWEGGARQISYSSPAVATLAGIEQVLIVNEDTVSGHDVGTGELLWEHPWPGRSYANASASQAVAVPPDRVFVSKGYGEGAALVRLVPGPDGALEVEALWRERRSLRTKHTNVVVKDGYVYGLSDGILECVELDTGKRAWKRGRYGHGQILRVGELLLVLTEDGEVVLIDPRPEAPAKELGRFQGIEGLTWNNLALSGDLLLIRNGREAAAYRLPLAG